MNLGILNTVIALVIVFLVLSLIVQSIQMFIKKILKLKSRQIVDSLEDLYEQAIETSTGTRATTPAVGQKTPAKAFTDRVVGEFTKIGRVTSFGNPVLDSLSKEDLFKIMAKLESENFVPDYVQRFQNLCNELNNLRKAIETLAANSVVKGATSAKLAEIRGVLAPVFNDVQSIVDESSKVRPRVLFGDLLRLGKLRPSGVLELLTEAQTAITSEVEVAIKTDPGSVAGLQTLSNELSKIARMIGDLSQKFDDAFAPLRGKLEQVETWYDTVMQSFDERYARSMKTVALCISIVVVIILNANFFKVYSSLSTNDVKRNLVFESGGKVLDAAKKANPGATQTPGSNAIAAIATSSTDPAGHTSIVTPSPSPTPMDIKKVVDQTNQDIDVYLSTYQEFGFSPITKDDVNSWLGSIVGRTLLRDEKGVPLCEATDRSVPLIDIRANPNCTPAWRDQSPAEWWASRRNDVFVLFGWAIMVLLLSVGAPFWQDTLESLFGIKNLLRQKSSTQNIETQSGAGQPKG